MKTVTPHDQEAFDKWWELWGAYMFKSCFGSIGTVVNGPLPLKKESRPWFRVNNSANAADPVEILIYDQIGKDWWSEDGIGAKDFAIALKAIPAARNIIVCINSPGGNVWDGMAIYSQLQQRRDKVVCRIDGVAASIASVIALAGHETQIPANALMMIHDPSGIVMGTAVDMRQMAEALDKHKDAIAAVYEKKTGKSKHLIDDAMSAETWFTGSEAKDYGLADTLLDEVVVTANFDFTGFRRVPVALSKPPANSTNPPADKSSSEPPTDMNKAQIIALLRKQGQTIADDATEDQLLAALAKLSTPPAGAPPGAAAPQPDPVIATLLATVTELKANNDKERKTRIEARVQEFINEDRLPAAQKASAVARALKDETYLDELAALPPNPPGHDPVSPMIDITQENPREIEKTILNLWGKGITSYEDAYKRGKARAEIIAGQWPRLLPVMNGNTISTELKRTLLLQHAMRAFAIRMLPLSAFSTMYNALRLEGTDKIAVPYYPLSQTASADFNPVNGYTAFTDMDVQAKTLTVDRRKYQGLKWTSAEIARQPYFNVAQGVLSKVEQLAADVVADVLSLVTAANFGPATKTEPFAAFDTDDIVDLKIAADLANWPATGRSLILNATYDGSLLKDSFVKSAANWGDNTPIREGRIARIGGFDYYPDSRIPANGENLQGFISVPSALIFGSALTPPTAEVNSVLSRYEIIVEPTSGATFEYRSWGNPDMDQSRQIIEISYGEAVGEPAALLRITSA